MTRETHRLTIRWFGIPISFTRVVERPSAPAPKKVITIRPEPPAAPRGYAPVFAFPFRKSA